MQSQPNLLPRWLRELDRLSVFKSQIYLYGNIKDTVLYPLAPPKNSLPNAEENWKIGSLRESLFETFKARGYGLVASYNLVEGMIFADNPSAGSPVPLLQIPAPPSQEGDALSMAQLYEQLVDAGEKVASATGKGGRHPKPINAEAPADIALQQMRSVLLNSRVPSVFIVEYSAQMIAAPTNIQGAERIPFLRMMKAAEEARTLSSKGENGARELQNLLVIVCDRLTDLPIWLYLNNPFGAGIEIEAPRGIERRHFFTRFLPELEKSAPDSRGKAPLEELVDLTEGLTTRELFAIRKIARPVLKSGEIFRAKNVVDRFKYGEKESEWDTLSPAKLRGAEETLARRVIGQPAATNMVADVLRRAKLGLSGAQHSSRSKPRGVLFFAGPTGVGKTELAKACAELVFGTQEACIRFDMSEYSAQHADQRLLGAPPGYIGFEEGGQLTNAVRANPFCVLLFDEIEKAHPAILDKFLPILEDGRMTDGRGQTVYFSEAIIVFTSNAGIYKLDPHTGRPLVDPLSGRPEMNVDPLLDTEYPVVRAKILEGVTSYFKHHLGRPELLNRIGQNIVVFDFVRQSTLRMILEKKVLPSIASQVKETHGVALQFEPPIVDKLMELGGNDVANGGRGIGNVAEAAILNPLARVLFEVLGDEKPGPNTLILENVAPPVDAQGRYELIWRVS